MYRVFKKKIIEYDSNWRVSDVNLTNSEKFKDWLFEKKYSSNYVSSFISRLIAVCNYSNLPLHKEFGKIKTFEKPKEDIIFLSDQDQEDIGKLELEGELHDARQWLLLGCQLGQRVGDLLKFDSYEEIEGVKIIFLNQEKTKSKVAIPINDKAWEIIKFGFPNKIPSYKFNGLIKRVCYRAKIERHPEIASHIMRRSFATNYYGKIPTPILMSITGHAKESTFLAYVGKSSLDKAFEAAKWFKKLS